MPEHSLLNVRESLARGLPVVMGFDVYDSFMSEAVAKSGVVTVPDTASESLQGGHAVLAVGYDDAKQALLIRNSWGPEWGIGGYCWMPYWYVTSGHASDFTVIMMEELGVDAVPDKPAAPVSVWQRLKTWIAALFAVSALAAAPGCVSVKQGEIAVFDLDFRKADQIQAGAREAEAPYRDWTSQSQPKIEEQVQAQSLPLVWWQELFNMIGKLECRVCLFHYRWKSRE